MKAELLKMTFAIVPAKKPIKFGSEPSVFLDILDVESSVPNLKTDQTEKDLGQLDGAGKVVRAKSEMEEIPSFSYIASTPQPALNDVNLIKVNYLEKPRQLSLIPPPIPTGYLQNDKPGKTDVLEATAKNTAELTQLNQLAPDRFTPNKSIIAELEPFTLPGKEVQEFKKTTGNSEVGLRNMEPPTAPIGAGKPNTNLDTIPRTNMQNNDLIAVNIIRVLGTDTAKSDQNNTISQPVTVSVSSPKLINGRQIMETVQTLHLQLQPENLGTVAIHMRRSGEQVFIEIETRQIQTETLLRSELGSLVRVLEVAGLSLEELIIRNNPAGEQIQNDSKSVTNQLSTKDENQPLNQKKSSTENHDHSANTTQSRREKTTRNPYREGVYL